MNTFQNEFKDNSSIKTSTQPMIYPNQHWEQAYQSMSYKIFPIFRNLFFILPNIRTYLQKNDPKSKFQRWIRWLTWIYLLLNTFNFVINELYNVKIWLQKFSLKKTSMSNFWAAHSGPERKVIVTHRQRANLFWGCVRANPTKPGFYYPTFADSHNSLNLASITLKISVIWKAFLNLAL